MHQVYKPTEGGSNEKLANRVFQVLDADLGTKKAPLEAKNYKKILSAIQKAKILHPIELSTLF